jgi:hypothetical protein
MWGELLLDSRWVGSGFALGGFALGGFWIQCSVVCFFVFCILDEMNINKYHNIYIVFGPPLCILYIYIFIFYILVPR